MNKILTFDIEEWYIEQKYHGGREWRYKEFDRILSEILNILDSLNIKATFFCLGKIAENFPYVIEAIAKHGHEIGCHSNEHVWLTKMSPDALRADTQQAIYLLENVSGQKIESYRAPAFSIGENNIWSIGILSECGIKNDASIFPAKRDFGGFPSFEGTMPCRIEYDNRIINELPIPICKIAHLQMAYSGGGYFRLLPYWFVKKQFDKADYVMCYFHMHDLLNEHTGFMSKHEYEIYFREAGSLKNRMTRYIKSNIGNSNAFAKLEKILNEYSFIGVKDFFRTSDINTLPSFHL